MSNVAGCHDDGNCPVLVLMISWGLCALSCQQVVYGLIRERRQEMAHSLTTGSEQQGTTRTDLLHSLLAARDEDGSGRVMLPFCRQASTRHSLMTAQM